MWTALCLSIVTTLSSPAPALDVPGESAGGGLKRGAFFGAKVGSVEEEARERLKLEAGTGIAISRRATCWSP
jgi:hypothetical protein